MVEGIQDPRRSEPNGLLGERDMLQAWLEFHRTTLLFKCEGVAAAALARRPVTTSLLSLHGLVRHMAEVERHWFQRTIDGSAKEAFIFGGDVDDDLPLAPLDNADWDADLAIWQGECAASRESAARHSLDDIGTNPHGDPVSLRWVYVHMIEEYARHNGHADLIRELVDGEVGW
jgi:Protein of unknown function (DUF664)